MYQRLRLVSKLGGGTKAICPRREVSDVFTENMNNKFGINRLAETTVSHQPHYKRKMEEKRIPSVKVFRQSFGSLTLAFPLSPRLGGRQTPPARLQAHQVAPLRTH